MFALISAFFFSFTGLNLFFYFILTLLKLFRHGKICFFDCQFFLLQNFSYFNLKLINFRHGTIAAKLNFGRCFINYVNCFIRQKTIVDITDRHFYCRFQRFILNRHAMMFFIIRAKPFQNLQSLLLRRFLHRNRLKTSFQRSILFDIPAIFFLRRCSDKLDFSSGQRWFQNIGCVQCSLRTTGSDDRMKFINK